MLLSFNHVQTNTNTFDFHLQWYFSLFIYPLSKNKVCLYIIMHSNICNSSSEILQECLCLDCTLLCSSVKHCQIQVNELLLCFCCVGTGSRGNHRIPDISIFNDLCFFTSFQSLFVAQTLI